MADRSIITPELCRQLLRYEPETGKLFWKERTPDLFDLPTIEQNERCCRLWNGRWAMSEAFTSNHDGYREGRIFWQPFRAHRVAWAIHYGEWPVAYIDHINGVRHDNRIANLRCVSRAENQMNITLPSNNTSGVIGVAWSASKKKWSAQIGTGGRVFNLGRYDRIEDAIAARKAAERRLGFHPNHGRHTRRPLITQPMLAGSRKTD